MSGIEGSSSNHGHYDHGHYDHDSGSDFDHELTKADFKNAEDFTNADTDGNGKITKEEWQAAVSNNEGTPPPLNT